MIRWMIRWPSKLWHWFTHEGLGLLIVLGGLGVIGTVIAVSACIHNARIAAAPLEVIHEGVLAEVRYVPGSWSRSPVNKLVFEDGARLVVAAYEPYSPPILTVGKRYTVWRRSATGDVRAGALKVSPSREELND